VCLDRDLVLGVGDIFERACSSCVLASLIDVEAEEFKMNSLLKSLSSEQKTIRSYVVVERQERLTSSPFTQAVRM
jgi:hypothetical protein